MVENSIVLPIARVRLDAQDLANLARRMAARRGGGDNTAKTRIRRRPSYSYNNSQFSVVAVWDLKLQNSELHSLKLD
jgi:hypothetical protein